MNQHAQSQSSLFEGEGLLEQVMLKQEFRFPWWQDRPILKPPATPDLFGHQAQPVECFGSGASAKWDMLGYMLVGAPLGVAATELSLALVPYLVNYLDKGGRVFVDSGAFGAHRAGTGLDFEREVFGKYDAILANTIRPNGLLLVMPDVIGDPAATARLQQAHVLKIRRWMASGAECIFPIQNPTQSPDSTYRGICDLVGTNAFTVGVPSNEHAWQAHQVVEFADRIQPRRIHLLGLTRQKVLSQISRDIATVSPGTMLSADACSIIAHVGRGRRITDGSASRLEDAIAWVEAGAEGVPIADLSTYLTDVLYEPDFLSEEQAVELASALGCIGLAWEAEFRSASHQGFLELMHYVFEDDLHAHTRAAEAVRTALYRPQVRDILKGPIRAYEVARIACGGDPEECRLIEVLRPPELLAA